MSTFDINDIVLQIHDDVENFYDHSTSLTPLSDILEGCNTMDFSNSKIKILHNYILILHTDNKEINDKIDDFLQAIKSKIFSKNSFINKNMQFLRIKDPNMLSNTKAKLAVIPSDIDLSNIDISLTPSIKIYSEIFYKQNPGKKIETWNFVLDILTS
ncbi:MAG: hypothetical protein KAH32_00855 [Chlamydiia bacterium]|nr:hypothetical protein [Chlamydiia bacterium]